jgi:hypothetical protein
MASQPLQPYAVGTPFEVQDTPEFRRVLNLRRRNWEEEAKKNDLYLRMTRVFKMPLGTQELRPIQAGALADAHDLRGLLAPARVGDGKTLVGFLLPTVVQNIKRPVLLVPAALIEKTWREYQTLARHWVCHPSFMTRARFDEAVISYEILGRDSGKDRINALRPDMIISDETHRLRNRQAACTKRVERFMIANPTTVFCGMSGTITKRSIMDYHHLLYWALREHMPMPRPDGEAEKWSEVLDEKKTDAIGRRAPGMLLQLCTEEERKVAKRTAPIGRTTQMPQIVFGEQLTAARKGYQKRLGDSPGVVCSSDKNIDCSLIIQRLKFDPGLVIQQHLNDLRETWETPNGDLLTLPTDIWRHARELACGFYYRWIPPPPDHWRQARKTWHWHVRQILDPEGLYYGRYVGMHIDSPMQVGLAISDGRITDPATVKAYETWVKVRGDYKINTVAEWVDDSTIRFCLDWLKENERGIVWTEHRAFGQRLSEMAGTGFCSNGGMDAEGRAIEDYDGKPVIASVQANHGGRNLQAWNRNLVVTAAPTGALWEQMIGRTHRLGQQADTVYVDWLDACDEQAQGFQQLMADAKYIQDTTGFSQKLLYADHI